MNLSNESSVGSVVADCPASARVFERHGIDYCCGGRQPLADACAAKGLKVCAILEELRAAAHEPSDDRDWSTAPLCELTDHIEQTHHARLKSELPRLAAMSRKIADIHGANHPEVVELAREYEVFAFDMIAHMVKEERILFPWIRRLERGEADGDGIAAPIGVMEHEHDDARRALDRVSELTNGFTPPEHACTTTRTLIASLRQLRDDTHLHMHKENNILFRRALQMGGPTPAPVHRPEARCDGRTTQCQARPRL